LNGHARSLVAHRSNKEKGSGKAGPLRARATIAEIHFGRKELFWGNEKKAKKEVVPWEDSKFHSNKG